MTPPLLIRPGLAWITLLYLVLAILFAARTPPWQAPDEPAHYNYIRYLAERGSFPVLHMGDYPHAYLEQIKGARFPSEMSVDPIRYEFHQPPLYYALMTPLYALAAGSLLALRLASVLLGVGIVWLAYATGRRAFPDRPTWALGAAAFVAFLPQHLATVSQVGNDVLAELLLAAALYVLVGWVQNVERGRRTGEIPPGPPPREPATWQPHIAMGVLLGLILITKTTAYIAVPLAAGILIWRWRQTPAALPQVLREGLAVALPAAAMALPWYGRNLWVYGWPDFLGLIRHDQIVVGQMRAAEYVAQFGWLAYGRRAVEWTFKSFWGVFGWMAVWLDTRVYLALAMLSGTAAAGLLLRTAHSAQRAARPATDLGGAAGVQVAARESPNAVRLLALSVLLALLAYAWYNTRFLQHQGRYLFTALIPMALAFAAGWEEIVRPGSGRWIAAGLALAGIGVAAWGVTAGPGLPKWPVAMLATAAVGAALLDLVLSVPAARKPAGLVAVGAARQAVAAAALAFPYAFLALVALYALLGEVVRLGG